MLLNIEESRLQPDIVLLRFVGRITLGRESQQIERKVADLIRDKASRVIFDLSGVTYMDSTGIGIVVMCSGKLHEAGGQLRLSGASGIVDQTLRMTGIHNVVPFHTTIDEAATAFGSGQQAAQAAGS